MRVLQVNKRYHPFIGGVERTLRNLCEGLTDLGHDCTVVCLGDGDGDVNGVHVVRTRELGEDMPNPFHLMALRRHSDVDVVQVHSAYPFISLQAMLLCVLRSKPFVLTPHYHAQGHSPMGRLLFPPMLRMMRRMAGRAAAVTANSRYEASLIRRDMGVDAEVIVPCVDGIDLSPRERGDHALYVGRLEEYKGAQHVIRAIAGMGIGLHIVGRGPYRDGLERLATELGVRDRVEFMEGLTDDELRDEYRRARVMVLVSRAEAYGMVVAECLSQGTPVVVSDSTALAEFASIPGCVTVPVDPSPDALRDAMRAAMSTEVGPLDDRIVTRDEWARRFERVLSNAQS